MRIKRSSYYKKLSKRAKRYVKLYKTYQKSKLNDLIRKLYLEQIERE